MQLFLAERFAGDGSSRLEFCETNNMHGGVSHTHTHMLASYHIVSQPRLPASYSRFVHAALRCAQNYNG